MCEAIIIGFVLLLAIEIKHKDLFNADIDNQGVSELLRQKHRSLSCRAGRVGLGRNQAVPIPACRELACEATEKDDATNNRSL